MMPRAIVTTDRKHSTFQYYTYSAFKSFCPLNSFGWLVQCNSLIFWLLFILPFQFALPLLHDNSHWVGGDVWTSFRKVNSSWKRGHAWPGMWCAESLTTLQHLWFAFRFRSEQLDRAEGVFRKLCPPWGTIFQLHWPLGTVSPSLLNFRSHHENGESRNFKLK